MKKRILLLVIFLSERGKYRERCRRNRPNWQQWITTVARRGWDHCGDCDLR